MTAALLAAIAADPDAIENWLVYADWLTERDDPRGELLVLELAIEAGMATEDVMVRHRALRSDEQVLLSPRLFEQSHHLELDLWRGFIRGATVFGPEDDPPSPEVLSALYADPHACLLRSLDLGWHVELCSTPGGDGIRNLELVPATPCELALDGGLPNLESLRLGGTSRRDLDSDSGPTRISHAGLRRLHVGRECPALRTGDFSLPALEALAIGHDPLELFGDGILGAPPPLLSTLECITSPGVLQALRESRLVRQLRRLACTIEEPLSDDDFRDLSALRGIEVSLAGSLETNEERETLLSRVSDVLPDATIEVTSLESYASEDDPEASPAATIDPGLAKTIAAGVQRLADRLRDRGW